MLTLARDSLSSTVMNGQAKSVGRIIKKVIAVLVGLGILSIVTPGFTESPYRNQTVLCAAVQNSRPSAWVLQKLGNEFFEQKNIRSVTAYPVAVRSVFVKGKDNRIFLVSRWHDLDPQQSYTFSCQWIDPDGQAYSVGSASFQTPETLDSGIFFTYTAYIDVHAEMKEGQWAVQIFLNGDLVEARGVVIASE